MNNNKTTIIPHTGLQRVFGSGNNRRHSRRTCRK